MYDERELKSSSNYIHIPSSHCGFNQYPVYTEKSKNVGAQINWRSPERKLKYEYLLVTYPLDSNILMI